MSRIKILLLIDGHGCTLHNNELIALDQNWTVMYRSLPGECPVADSGTANRIMYNSLGFQNHKYVRRNDRAGYTTPAERRNTTNWCQQVVSGLSANPSLIRDMEFIRDFDDDTFQGLTGGFENTATWYGVSADGEQTKFFKEYNLANDIKLSTILGEYSNVLHENHVSKEQVVQLWIYINTCRSMCDPKSTPEILQAWEMVFDTPVPPNIIIDEETGEEYDLNDLAHIDIDDEEEEEEEEEEEDIIFEFPVDDNEFDAIPGMNSQEESLNSYIDDMMAMDD